MEVMIERILPGGLGLAHAEGKTIMVALAAPGDRLRVRIDRVKGNVSFALIEEIISPSPYRVEPPCPYFGRCGGCDFQQMSYQAQLEAKAEIIRDCLRRLGRIESVTDFQVTPAPNAWHYRSRAQWQHDSIRQRLGYFESGTRSVCDVADCAVLAPLLQQTLEGLRSRMRDGSLPEDVRDIRAVLGDDGVSIAAPVLGKSSNAGDGSAERGSSPTTGPPAGQPGWGGAVREGSVFERRGVPDITRTIHGETYHLNAESFFQANDDLSPQLIDSAVDGAGGETAIELYCGVGLFTLPLTRRFTHVVGIEGDRTAAAFARTNLSHAGLTNAQIVNQDVGRWLAEITESASAKAAALKDRLDFLLLDPPRTGAESRVVAGILKLKPKRICYVSCDPATLARDLKKLIAGGYTLQTIAAFDMFPQTHHVETVVQLIRESY